MLHAWKHYICCILACLCFAAQQHAELHAGATVLAAGTTAEGQVCAICCCFWEYQLSIADHSLQASSINSEIAEDTASPVHSIVVDQLPDEDCLCKPHKLLPSGNTTKPDGGGRYGGIYGHRRGYDVQLEW